MKAGISAELRAHYRSGATTLARLWKVVRRDGAVLGFTDHDTTIAYPPGDAALDYRSTSVFDASANSSRSELNVDTMEAIGLLSDVGITAEDLEAGLWDGAEVSIIEVNYRDLTMGHNPGRFGVLGNLQHKQGQFVVELRGLMQALQNTIGRTITPTCPADLGDAFCKVDLEALRQTSSVGTVTSQRTFVGLGLDDTTGWFDYGEVLFSGGANTGLRMEVKAHTKAGGDAELVLVLPMPFALTEGDAFSIVPGCDKRKEIDANGVVLGDCVNKYDNLLNFRGFSFVPGPDRVGQIGGQ